jgi:hypothetical protein
VQALVSEDGVFGRERSGWGYRRIGAGGGHMPGSADLPGGDDGILVRQGCGHVTVGAGEALHRGRDPYPPRLGSIAEPYWPRLPATRRKGLAHGVDALRRRRTSVGLGTLARGATMNPAPFDRYDIEPGIRDQTTVFR